MIVGSSVTDVYTLYRPVVGLILLCKIKPTTVVSTSKFCGFATKLGSVPTKAKGQIMVEPV